MTQEIGVTYQTSHQYYADAYELGDERVSAGYGWPLEVDPQLVKTYEKIRSLMDPRRALDVGCGQGRHSLYFAEQGLDVYGVDFVEQAVVEARQQAETRGLTNASFQVGQVLDLPFADEFFDIVLDWSVMDHVLAEDHSRYLQEIARVLKVGGFLILTEFSASDKRLEGKSQKFLYDRGSYDHYFTIEEMRALLESHYQIIELNETMLETPPPHLMLNVLARKKIKIKI